MKNRMNAPNANDAFLEGSLALRIIQQPKAVDIIMKEGMAAAGFIIPLAKAILARISPMLNIRPIPSNIRLCELLNKVVRGVVLEIGWILDHIQHPKPKANGGSTGKR